MTRYWFLWGVAQSKKAAIFVKATVDDFWASGLDKERTDHTYHTAWPIKTRCGNSWLTSYLLILTTTVPLSTRIPHRECPKTAPSGPSLVCSASSETQESAIAAVQGKMHQSESLKQAKSNGIHFL